jgi:hypothetical protein
MYVACHPRLSLEGRGQRALRITFHCPVGCDEGLDMRGTRGAGTEKSRK